MVSGRVMASVNQTRPHCVNQIGKTHSKLLAARHGRGTAWARHSMCELAFVQVRSKLLLANIFKTDYSLKIQQYSCSNFVADISDSMFVYQILLCNSASYLPPSSCMRIGTYYKVLYIPS